MRANLNGAQFFQAGDYFKLRNMKLEKGTMATDWSPAPEDISTEIAAVQTFAEGIQSYSQGIQAQLDGKIDTWFYSVPPSASVPPENGWAADEKAGHTDDLYYDTSSGFCYRYTGTAWVRIKDSDITAAMTAAGTAQDTADNKRRVFTSTPAPPYDIGDMWAGGTAGDLKVCKTAKARGASYAAADWMLASKYTDNTLAAAAQTAAAAAQADIDALAVGGRNLIWGTLNPSVDVGSRPAINGIHSDGTNHGGEMVINGSATLEETEHGLKAVNSSAVRTYIRFGSNTAASGSIQSLSSTFNPNTLWPWTTWRKLTDVFLFAAGGDQSLNATGGEASHTLTVSEMPNHIHPVPGYAASDPNTSPVAIRTQPDGNFVVYNSAGDTAYWSSGTYGHGNETKGHRCVELGEDGYTGANGAGQAISLMPPFLAVNTWTRLT